MRVWSVGLPALPLLVAILMASSGAARADDGGGNQDGGATDAAAAADDAGSPGDTDAQACANNATPDDAGACNAISQSKVGGCALGVSAHTAREGIGAVGLALAISIAIALRRRAPRDIVK